MAACAKILDITESLDGAHIMAACAKTLDITELLERILLHLPLKDLLLAQRVSKGWRDLIQDSQRTKQALFLQGTSDISIVYDQGQLRDTSLKPAWKTSGNSWLDAKPVLNPLISRHTGSGPGYRTENQAVHIVHEGFVDPANPKGRTQKMKDRLRAVHLHLPEASWRRMMVLQPPVSKLQCCCMRLLQVGHRVDVIAAQSKDGHMLTLDEMVHSIRMHWLGCKRCREPDDEVFLAMLMDLHYENAGLVKPARKVWTYFGDDDTDLVHPNITGWEMLAEFARRSGVVSVRP